MRRFFKALAWIVGIMATLVIAAAIFIFLIFDPNKYKSEIAAAVHDATGRELTIQGDLKLSLFPWLGVETGAMTLNNPPEFGRQPFAKIEDAAIKVKLLPLLNKNVEVDTVTLNGLYLNLVRTAAGHGNWEDLAATNGKTAAAAPSQPATAAPLLATFAIGGIRVQNATVIWDDRQSKSRYELNKLSLHTGPISPTAPITLTLATEIKSSAPALSAQLNLTTQARYDSVARQLQLTGLKLTATARGAALPADETKLTVTTDALLSIPEKQYHLTKLKLLASLRGDTLPGKQVTAALDGNVMLDLGQETLRIDPLSLEAWDVKVNGALQGRGLLTTPQLSGTLTIPEFNARDLLGRLSSTAPNTADRRALAAVSADVTFNASPAAVEITKLDARLDQTRISGKASISGFAHPAYRFQLAVDDIDADRYLPPATAASTKPAMPAAAAGAGAAELPLPLLRTLDVDGDLSIAKLRIAKLKLSAIKVGIKAAAGVIRTKPLAAQLYGGSYRGDLRLDARGSTLQLGMNETLSAIEIGPLTRDLLQKDLVAGSGDVHLQLTGSGLNPDQLKRTVSGNIAFSLHDGRVNGVNLLDMIQKDYVKYIQDLAIDAGRLNQTVFSTFAATATVDKGLITTHDLALNSAQLDVKGRGTVNLPDERLALHLDAVPRGQLARQLGQFKDTVIPVRIEGTLSAPQFTTDLDEVLKQKAKARLEKEEQKAKEELQRKADEEKAKLQQKLEQKQDQLEQKLQDKLKGLFK
jgi:AsmA protein